MNNFFKPIAPTINCGTVVINQIDMFQSQRNSSLVEGLDFEYLNQSKIEMTFKEKQFYNCYFHGFNFENMDLTNTNFFNCQFYDINIRFRPDHKEKSNIENIKVGSIIDVPLGKENDKILISSLRKVQENKSFKRESGYVYYVTVYNLTHNKIYENCAIGNHMTNMHGDFIKIGRFANCFFVVEN